MTVDASLLHPITGQCPLLHRRRRGTLSKAPSRGVAADTYYVVRRGMFLACYAVGAMPSHKPQALADVSARRKFLISWSRLNDDANARTALHAFRERVDSLSRSSRVTASIQTLPCHTTTTARPTCSGMACALPRTDPEPLSAASHRHIAHIDTQGLAVPTAPCLPYPLQTGPLAHNRSNT